MGAFMSTRLTTLRRTVAIIGAISATTAFDAVGAGTVTLSNGNSCNWTSMSVDVAGAITIQCTVVDNPPPAAEATFAIDAPSSLQPGAYSLDVKVRRVTGTANKNYTVRYTATGAGCELASNPVRDLPLWFNGQAWDVPIQTSAGGGACTVSLTNLPSNTTASPSFRSISVGTVTTPPPTGGPPVPAGCPALPSDYK
jgi:hypothetical protein